MIPALQAPFDTQQRADVTALTEQATEALQSVNLAAEAVQRVPRGTCVTFSVPIDTESNPRSHKIAGPESIQNHGSLRVHTNYRRTEPLCRDSLKRREALLKGKEGSRQRRRWENDRLLNNPWAQPPLPIDWEIHPTYPRRAVPYYLAPLWDAEAFERSIERKMKGKKQGRRAGIGPAEEAASNVPKEVRSRLKHARAAKGLLQDLEEEVRIFLREWNEKDTKSAEDGLHDVDSEEEEIVFIGRNGQMHDSPVRDKTFEGLQRDKLVFDGLVEDRGASFGRWLVHSIATYYGLRTWSRTVGDPARREAYVGLGDKRSALNCEAKLELPKPLWGMI